MINIVKYRYYYFGLSLLIIIPGLIALLAWGLPLAIDFTGGSLLDIRFESGTRPQPADIIAVYAQMDYPDTQVQTSGDTGVIIRSKSMDDQTMTKIVADLEKIAAGKIVIQRFDNVGPAVGQEVASRAALAVALASIGIMLYITFAFRGVAHAFRYGIAAIIAMLHDVLVVIGVGAIIGKLVGWEIDALFLTALLTVIGFSVHDTIVVFDRIRENSNTLRRLPYETIVNHSIVQTLDRSINTSLMVVIVLLSMALLGGITIRHFVIILLVGVVSGTYSSIFNAAPILVVWENREWRTWFKRGTKREATI